MRLISFFQTLLPFSLLLYSIPGRAQPFTDRDSLRGEWHAERRNQDLEHYRLRLRVIPENRYLEGQNTLTFRSLEPLRTFQIDLAENFDIVSMVSSEGEVRFGRTGSSIRVQLPRKIPAQTRFWLEVRYRGHPHVAAQAPWDGGFVWAKDKEGFPWIGVACEGEGASLWFPAKDHPGDEPDSVSLEYEVPRGLTAVGNGQFMGRKAQSDSTHTFFYKVTHPINHYNITLVAGAFRSWSDTLRLPKTQAILPLSFYALPEDEAKAKRQWQQSKTVLRVLSELFGDYPFTRDGYRLVQTPFLGMEHQSCIAYGDRFEDNPFGFDFILMHETGHEWWGNALSASDHADLWLHESFCTYAEALFVEKTQGQEKARNYLLGQKKKIKNRTPVQGPRSVYFNGWKDSDMYYKGSWMLHSLRYIIHQDSVWRAFFPHLVEKFGRTPVSGNTVRSYFSQYFRQNLDPFFAQYLDQTQIPILEARRSPQNPDQTEFRWKSTVPGFAYPVPVLCKSEIIRVNAGPEWTICSECPPESLQAAEGYFLYRLEVGR